MKTIKRLRIYLFLLFASVLSTHYTSAQCTVDAYGNYGFANPTCGSGSFGAWANACTDCYSREYTTVNVTAGRIYEFQSYQASNGAQRFTTITTTGNVALASGNTTNITSLSWTATLTGSVRFWTHLNSTCGANTTNTVRRMRCNIPPPPPSCSGTPAAGTASASVASVCSSVNFTLNATGLTSGAGISYIWQRSTNGGGTWNDITGATSASATVSQTVNTQYRIRTTCSNSGLSANSNTVTVNMLAGACQCATYPLISATNAADTEISSVTVGAMTNNVNTCAAAAPGAGSIAGRYSNFTGSVTGPSVMAGASVNFSLTQNSCSGTNYTNFFQVYVDWNQDGDFLDAGEQVYSQPGTGAAQTVTGSFTVPGGATSGTTRMRIVCIENFNSTTNYAHNAYTYGETEDYCFTVQAPTPCSGTPAPGNTISSSPSVTPGGTVNLSLQNATSGSGVSYQWQSGPSSSGPWSTFGTSSATQTSPVITATTWFRCNVTCSGNTGSSNPVQVTFNPYCVPTVTFGCTDGDVIARVILNTLDNNSGTGCPSGTLGYSDYTSNPSLTTTLLPSSSYNCTVFAGQYNANYAAWIDYNDNNIFETSERIGYTLSTVAGSGFVGVLGSSANFPVTLACTPPPGPHRLRIREIYGLIDGSTITPCNNASYGEIEDYTITIAAAPACPSPGLVSSITTTTSSATITWATNCASGTQYDFEYGPAGFTQGTGTLLTNQTVSLSAPNASFVLPGLSSNTTYNIYYRSNCGGSVTSAWSIVNSFTTQAAPPACATGLTATPTTPGCGNYPVTLTWNAVAGATAYLVSLGTTPGGTQIANNQNNGNNTTVTFNGPTINTTYYWRVIPTNIAGNAVGCSEVSFTTGSTLCACIPDYTGYGGTPQNGSEGTVDGDMITNVTITLGSTTLLNNSSTSTPSTPQYTFYSSLPQINLVAANTYNVNVTAGAFTNQNFAVWIDYNDDNDFNDPGELIGFSSSATTTAFETISFPINLACNPPLGTHRMRIRDVYATAGNTIDPCATYGWGETEDYLITIVPGAPFTPVFASTPTNPSCITPVTYTANSGQTSYSWSLTGTSGVDYTINAGGTPTSNTLNVTWLTTGSKTVTMNYNSPLGCSSSGAVSNIINILPSAVVASVSGSSPLCIGETPTFTANGVVLGGGSGAWSSSNTAVATVNATTGVVTAVGSGTCDITYTITGGCNGTPSASTALTVTPTAAVTSVSGTSPLCIGETPTFTANGVVLGGGSGAWSSSNTAVATVNSTTGVVTAVGSGTCDITYTITGGCNGTPSASTTLTVIPTAAVSSVSGTSPLCINGTATFTATGVVLGGGSGAWSSSNTAVATVNASTGVVTALSLGTADITYTVTGGCNGTASGSAGVTVAPCTYNWTGIVSSDWNTTGNWATGIVPTASDNAIIPNVSPNFFPVLDIPVFVNDVFIASGASVNVSPTSGLTLDGTLTNNGTFTLQSDNSGTGWLDDFTLGGTVVGNIRVQRYVPIGVAGFRQLGTPVNMPNISGVQGFTPTGTTGFVIPLPDCNPNWVEWNSPYGNWMQLVENGPVQFNCYQSLYQVLTSGGMTKGRGYYMDVPGGTTLTFVGAPNTGSISDYTATNLNGSVTNGWNIVSNPYPSPLRWSMADVPAGFDAIAQVWVTSGTYLGTFQPVDPNTPGQGIAIGQAFQLRVSNPGTSVPFSVSNANRTTAPPSFLFAGNDPMTLNIDMSIGSYADMTKIRFMEDASPIYDGLFDSYKVLGNANQPMVYSILDNVNMSINSYGNLTDVYTVPLGIKAGTAGEHTFTFSNMDQFPASTLIYLEDTETTTWQNMRVDESYTFTAPLGTHNGRFLVHFYPPVLTETADALCEVPGSVTITSASPAEWNYTLTDAQSTTVSSGLLNGSLTITNVNAGDYELSLTEVQSGYTAVETVTVNGTSAVVAQAIASSLNVQEGQEIQFTANAQNADTYNWSFGDGTTSADVNPLHTYNLDGTYEVILTASNSTNTCSAVSTLSVTVSEAATSSVEEMEAEEVKMWNVDNTVFIRFGSEWAGKTTFTLYDAAGKRVMNKQLNNAQGTVTIDCGVLAPGIYTAELSNGKKVVTHKASMGIK